MRLVVALLLTTFLAAAVIGTAQAEILITVDKSAQRMNVARDGEPLYTWPVSTGRSGYATPSGSYTAFRMEADHYSKEWDEAPMPHSIFFTQEGHAIHGSGHVKAIGTPASHGCVRLEPRNASILFSLVKQQHMSNTRVVPLAREVVALHAERLELAGRRIIAVRAGGHRPDVARIAVDRDGHLLLGLVDGYENVGARGGRERQHRDDGGERRQQAAETHAIPPALKRTCKV